MYERSKDESSAWIGGSAPSCVFAAVLLFGLISGASRSADAETDAVDPEDPRGKYSFFLEAVAEPIVQRAKASGTSSFDVSSDKANILTNLTVRLGGGVKAPAIEALPGAPRPVVWAGALIPVNESSTIGTKFVEDTSIRGTEKILFSKYSIEFQTSALAGLGLEFSVPVFDTYMTVTPGIESMHLFARYTGALSLQVNRGQTSTNFSARAKKEIVQHYFGPALRVAAPTIVVRGLALNFFLDGGALFDVAGTRRQLLGRGPGSETASMTFESGTATFHVGLGFQARFP